MSDIFYRTKNIFGSEADWASNDIVIAQGELAFCLFPNGDIQGKVGDGSSLFSQLEYSIGYPAVPLAGNDDTNPITGTLTFRNDALDKQILMGITTDFSVDDFVIASSGTNIANSNVYIAVNAMVWEFRNDGRLVGPTYTYGPADDLVLANKLYVDTAVAGGVSADFIPLVGTGGTPVTGAIEFENVTINKAYGFGIIEGSGVDNLAIYATGANLVNTSFLISMNTYNYSFMNTGRLLLPDITFGVGDELAAVNKQYVDSVFAVLNARLTALEP